MTLIITIIIITITQRQTAVVLMALSIQLAQKVTKGNPDLSSLQLTELRFRLMKMSLLTDLRSVWPS